jgi:hypothetical protein
MQTTTDFFNWFFSGLNGLGGWFLFLLLAVTAIIFVLYDVSRRRLAATGWKMGIVLLAFLLLPAIIYRFSGVDTQRSLDQFKEVIFYLGLLGGILPPVLAAGYYVTFRGMATCERGHQYDTSLGGCPECMRIDEEIRLRKQPVVPIGPVGGSAPVNRIPPTAIGPTQPPRRTAPAWLVGSGHNFQLCQGETSIGRHSKNDIQISGDDTVGREHAKITESNGHFRLIDLGSQNGTFVNGRRLREPQLLDNGDEIRFGTGTILRFTSGQ